MEPFVTIENIDEKTREWLEAISPYNQHEMELNVDAAALLLIDCQRYFLDENLAAYCVGGVAALPNMKKLMNAFRKAGRPVIYTIHVHHPDGSDAGILEWWWGDMIIDGTPEAEIIDELAPLPDEHVIRKHRYSAFNSTDLEIILRCLGIEDLVIAGVMTNNCCETTARDAFMQDYRVFFPVDANGTATEEMQLATLMNLSWAFAYVPTTQELLAALGRK
jgi:nicotinamidase-related amidase